MKKKIIGALALLTCTTIANANWVGSVNYSSFSDKFGPSQDLDLGALGATFGYRFELTDKITLVPEARIGFGLGGDTVTIESEQNIRDDFEINDYYGVAVRGEYVVYDHVYVFGVLSYQNIEIKLDAVRVDGEPVIFDGLTLSQTDLGIGLGAGWHINERNALELSYEDIDGTGLITAGYRVSF